MKAFFKASQAGHVTCFIVLLTLTLAMPAHAQLTSSSLLGTVTDTMDASMVGVKVALRNLATGAERQVLSDGAGVYRFLGVEPGLYSVEFAMKGFQSRKIPNLTVGTAQELVINQTLPVSPVVSQVEVVAPVGEDVVKTTATISRTLDQRLVSELPTTANRDVTRLAVLAPLVVRAPGSNEFSSNGQRARNTDFLLDGSENNDFTVTLPSARMIPEGIAEFRIQSLTYSAEFGRNSGAQISAITRRGTDLFHGEAWDYYRANWMEPLALANKRAGLTATPRFNQNQGGGSLGGPILKGRTFFFGLFEVNRRREAPDARNATSTDIPTPTGYATLRNVPLATGQTPESRQAVLDELSFLPDIHSQVTSYDRIRNVLVNNVPVEIGTIVLPLARPANLWYSTGRVDHKLSNGDNLYYRYQLDHRDEPNVASNLRFGPKWAASQQIFAQNHAIGYTSAITPMLLNEFRASYVRRSLAFPENDPESSTVNISGFTTIGGMSNFPQGRLSDIYQFQDTATYVKGKHTLKGGFDVRFNRLFNRAGTNFKGTWTFNSLQDFMNNQAARLDQAVNEATFDARQTNQYYFVQDDFKVARSLTFNLGLRYEYSNIPLGFFGAANDEIAAVGVPRPPRPDRNNWAPRIGFAYSPRVSNGFLGTVFGEDQSSIRGGFGVAYDILFFNILTAAASNYPRVVTSTTQPPATINLFPTLAPKITTVPALNPLMPFNNTPEDLQSPTTNFWSMSFQRQFKKDFNLEIGYSGNRSYHQIRQGEANPPVLTEDQAAAVVAAQNSGAVPNVQQRRVNPAWGSRVTIESTGKAEYNAAYIKFDKKMSHGLLIGANYAFSSNFSDSDELLAVQNLADSSPQVPQNYFDYRPEWSRSVFDRPHRFAVHYVYELPWFKNGFADSPVLRQVFSGWQISGFTEFESGQPFTIRTGVDSAGMGNNDTGMASRPNYNSGGVLLLDPSTHDLRTFSIPLNGTGIVTTPLGTNGQPLANSMSGGGSLGRNTFRGPGFASWNFSIGKTFPITDRVAFQFRSDFIDFFNQNNFRNPENRMNSTSFGQNNSQLITDNRSILLSGRLRF